MGVYDTVVDTTKEVWNSITAENFKEDDDRKADFLIGAMEMGDDIDMYLQISEEPEVVRGLVGRRIMEKYPDINRDDMFKHIKAPETSGQLLDENPIMRMAGGIGRDYRELAYGIRKLTPGMDEAPELQKERKDFIGEYDKAEKFMSGFNANYDSDGERDEAQNWWGGAGEMGPDAVIGMGVAGNAKTMTKALVGDMAMTAGTETARYQEHESGARLGMGMGMALAGNVVGNYIGGLAKDAPVQQQKTAAMLDEQLAFLEDLDKNMGGEFTPEMLANPELLKKKVAKTAKNVGERDRLFAAIDKMEVGIIERINLAAEELGTNAKMLAKYKRGELTDFEMGKEFNNYLNEKKAWYKADEAMLYDLAKKTDVDPETGVQRLYDTEDLFAQVNKTGVRNKEALAVFNNELRFLDNINTPQMKQLDEGLISVRKELTTANKKINKIDNRLKRIQDRKVILYKQINEVTDKTKDSSYARLLQERDNLIREGKTLVAEKSDLKVSKGSYIDAVETMNREKDALTPRGDENVDLTQMNGNQLRLVDQRISEKINAPGGILSQSDAQQMGTLRELHNDLKTFMKDTIVDPKYHEIMDQAKQTSRNRFNLTGRKTRMGDVNKALLDNNPENLYRLVSDGKDGINNLRGLKETLGENDEMYQSIVSKVYNDKIMKGVRTHTAPNEPLKMNFEKLADNLNKMDMQELEEMAPQVAQQFKGIKYMTNAFADTFRELQNSKALPPGELKSLKGRLMDTIRSMGMDAEEYVSDIGYGIAKSVNNVKGVESNFKGTYKPRWFDRGADLSSLINQTKHELDGKQAEVQVRMIKETLDEVDSWGTQLGKAYKESFEPGTNMRAGGIAGSKKDLP